MAARGSSRTIHVRFRDPRVYEALRKAAAAEVRTAAQWIEYLVTRELDLLPPAPGQKPKSKSSKSG